MNFVQMGIVLGTSMEDLVAIAWLLTLVVLILSGRYRRVLPPQPSVPDSTFFRFYGVFVIPFCCLVIAPHFLVGPLAFFGISVLVWNSVAMLILVWRQFIFTGKHGF